MLTESQIKKFKLIVGGEEGQYQATTYDLTIGSFITPNGDHECLNSVKLQPQGIAWVVSKELLSLPDRITCHTTLKNELSRKGILAINTGIVDPRFSGPISTALVNFSREVCVLKIGQSVLRLTFYEHEPTHEKRKLEYKRQEYVDKLTDEVVDKFSDSFLNVDLIAKKIRDETIGTFIRNITFWLAILLFILALATLLATVFMSGQAMTK